jgi:Cap4 SAVED domain
MALYDTKPDRFLECRYSVKTANPNVEIYCAGFELNTWRAAPFAYHLVEWLPDYALPEEELQAINHANAVVKLRQAAIRVYTSDKYKKRGEAGEIALHAICRDFFDTIPISPRVFYKSTSNDVIKSFDLVHARFPKNQPFEIWLGESKLYTNPADAMTDAIKSINDHIDRGFLTSQKLLLGPQIPKQHLITMKFFRSLRPKQA